MAKKKYLLPLVSWTPHPDELRLILRGTAYLNPIFIHATCTGFCPFHKRSGHPLRSAPMAWRENLGRVDRVCPHGVIHPDTDSLGYLRKTHLWDTISINDPQHREDCDGCCGQDLSPWEPKPSSTFKGNDFKTVPILDPWVPIVASFQNRRSSYPQTPVNYPQVFTQVFPQPYINRQRNIVLGNFNQ